MTIAYRNLTTLDDFGAVVDLERRIWGPAYDEVVPVPILAVTVKRGGILIGAFDSGRMIAFVYSIAGIRNGRPTQWSHMLGVVDEHRRSGLGRRLKLLQRERAVAMGLDLIEWTFDPLQAANAHLNFARLGVVVEEYEENIYGESNIFRRLSGGRLQRTSVAWRIIHKEIIFLSMNHSLSSVQKLIGRSLAGIGLTGLVDRFHHGTFRQLAVD